MRTYLEVTSRLEEYMGYDFIYIDGVGYIAWQCSTGENYEILLVEVAEKRKGYGRKLMKMMCDKIKPYHSVFVFRQASNEEAGFFYRAMGFEETRIPGLYKGGDAILGVVPFEKLKTLTG